MFGQIIREQPPIVVSVQGRSLRHKERFLTFCISCNEPYSTSRQNEDKKKTRWQCTICCSSQTKSLETKRKISNFVQSHLDEYRQRSSGSNNPMFGRKHPEETRQRMRGRIWSDESRKKFSKKCSEDLSRGKRRAKRTEFTKLDGESLWADSMLEYRRMQFLESNPLVRFWTKNHGLTIEYFCEKTRRYVPDFFVELFDGRCFIEEMKGWIRCPEEHVAKCSAAQSFCSEEGWNYRVLTTKEVLRSWG